MKILPADNSYRTFCELTTGYRMFCVISAALDAGIIDRLEQGAATAEDLLAATSLTPAAGERFIDLLVNVGLLEQYDGKLLLSRFAQTYLSRSSATSQRQVLAFEPLLMANWSQLGLVLRDGQGALIQEQAPDAYRQRLHLFQQAMAETARVRSRELWDTLTLLPASGTIIDIGAGDGTYLREFLRRQPQWRGIACDLPDVCTHAATNEIPDNLSFHPCNIMDQRELTDFVADHAGAADLLLFSNLCHCYSPEENVALLHQAAPLLAAEGLVVVHDFFRDANDFGALYDLHMLVNTYNGRSYTIAETAAMLTAAGFGQQTLLELPSNSLALVASRSTPYPAGASTFTLKSQAQALGFFAAVELDPARIRSEAWVRAKCAYGCGEYGRRWSCPPHAMDQAQFQKLLKCYSRALLVAGQPPLRTFQEQLLALERQAFLEGFKKALVFSGGPCSFCERCDEKQCRYPEKRRPSLEGCGCDVFALAASCGLQVAPLKNSDDFVQYVGLLLVD